MRRRGDLWGFIGGLEKSKIFPMAGNPSLHFSQNVVQLYHENGIGKDANPSSLTIEYGRRTASLPPRREVKMATKISWTNVGSTLVAVGKEGKVSFNIDEIFPKLMDNYTDIQRAIIFYGVKQKLADATAKEKDYQLTEQEKFKIMQERFEDLKKGIWTRKAERKDAKAILQDAIAGAGLSEKELAVAQKLLEYLEAKGSKASKKNKK